jgi:hypothetical protein
VTAGDPTDTEGQQEPALESKGDSKRRRRGLFRRFTDAPWWAHVLAALGAVFALLVAGVAALALVFVDITLERGALPPGIPPQTEVTGDEARELAERFAPMLRYDSRELFVPIPRAAYLSRTELKRERGTVVPEVLEKLVSESNLPIDPGDCLKDCLLFLDVRGAEPDPPERVEKRYDAIEEELLESGARPTVYYHVTHYDDTDEYAVQYWFLYFFNYRLNEHESDWEQITVRLDENREPTAVFYSAHEGGNTGAFAKVAESGHPVAYPALGSHANYFRSGPHEVKLVCRRVLANISPCLRGGKLLNDVNNGDGEELSLGDGGYELARLEGPLFIGSYGSGNYVVLTRQKSVLGDPRARTAWLDPLRRLR